MKDKIKWSLIEPYIKDIEERVYYELDLMFTRLETGFGKDRNNFRCFDYVSEAVIGYGVPEDNEIGFTLNEIVNYSKKYLSLDAGYAIQSVLGGLINEKKITITQRDFEKICSIPEGILERERDNSKSHKDPYEALLMEMIEPLKGHGTWKEILMPYHAAVIENVLPLWSHKIFVEKTGLNVSQSTYSECMNENRYSDDELEPYANRFAQLKMKIENSK